MSSKSPKALKRKRKRFVGHNQHEVEPWRAERRRMVRLLGIRQLKRRDQATRRESDVERTPRTIRIEGFSLELAGSEPVEFGPGTMTLITTKGDE